MITLEQDLTVVGDLDFYSGKRRSDSSQNDVVQPE
jgi:hypothetical protein